MTKELDEQSEMREIAELRKKVVDGNIDSQKKLGERQLLFGRKYEDLDSLKEAEEQFTKIGEHYETKGDYRNASRFYTTAAKISEDIGKIYAGKTPDYRRVPVDKKCISGSFTEEEWAYANSNSRAETLREKAEANRHRASIEKIIQDKKFGMVRRWIVKRKFNQYTIAIFFIVSFLFSYPSLTGFGILSSNSYVFSSLGVLFFIFGVISLGIFLYVKIFVLDIIC